MTGITYTDAAEVRWAGTEQGKAAVAAAWREAERLCVAMTTATAAAKAVTMPDIGAIVYAAYLAAGWDAERAEGSEPPAHDHQWVILAAQPHIPATFTVVFGKPVPHTIVLLRCTECGEPDSRMLPGEWTLHELREDPA